MQRTHEPVVLYENSIHVLIDLDVLAGITSDVMPTWLITSGLQQKDWQNFTWNGPHHFALTLLFVMKPYNGTVGKMNKGSIASNLHFVGVRL